MLTTVTHCCSANGQSYSVAWFPSRKSEESITIFGPSQMMAHCPTDVWEKLHRNIVLSMPNKLDMSDSLSLLLDGAGFLEPVRLLEPVASLEPAWLLGYIQYRIDWAVRLQMQQRISLWKMNVYAVRLQCFFLHSNNSPRLVMKWIPCSCRQFFLIVEFFFLEEGVEESLFANVAWEIILYLPGTEVYFQGSIVHFQAILAGASAKM